MLTQAHRVLAGLCLSCQVHREESINGCTVGGLLLYGVVQLETETQDETRIQMSKFLLRLVCLKDRLRASKRAPTYLPPDTILRTIRDYYGEVQELAHLWSLVIAFNALVSLVYDGPRAITFQALRPGATFLEPPLPATTTTTTTTTTTPDATKKGTLPAQAAASDAQAQSKTGPDAGETGATKTDAEEAGTLRSKLLAELLHVDRNSEEGKQKDVSRNFLHVLAQVDEKGRVDGEARVDLHDIVNQPMFTASLTKPNAKGVDAWAMIKHHEDKADADEGAVGSARKEDVVVLLQTKGKMTGMAVLRDGGDAPVHLGALRGYVESLMRSAIESADKLLKSSLVQIKAANGCEDMCCRLAVAVCETMRERVCVRE